MKITTRNLALVAIFAALYYVLSLIAPINIPTGVGNLAISFAALIAAVIGLVLGPYLGTASALLGASIAWVLPPSGGNLFGLPFLLAPALNALVTGLIFYKKWQFGFAIFGAIIVAFLFTPPIWPVTENWLIAGRRSFRQNRRVSLDFTGCFIRETTILCQSIFFLFSAVFHRKSS